MKTAVVVAHPDDEVLWAGGYISSHPGTDVLCCTIPVKDPERCLVFLDVCRQLGARGIVVADTPDVVGQDIGSLLTMQKLVQSYELVLTHNAIGEYGHAHHIAVHNAVRETGVPMKVFGYGLTKEGEDVDLQLKERLLAQYRTRPRCFQVWSHKFDLSKEAFLNVDRCS